MEAFGEKENLKSSVYSVCKCLFVVYRGWGVSYFRC